MDNTKKLMIALAVLAALIGGVYLQHKDEKKEQAAHSLEARAAALPKIEISEELTGEIDTVELVVPAKEAKAEDMEASDEGEDPEVDGESTKIVLTKVGEEDWELKEPVSYKANASNVKSLLNNLKSLKVTEQISQGGDSYEKWGVDDKKGLHAVFKKGDQVVLDVVFGESGSRGQMTRLKDKEGVYAVKGYSKYLYSRDAAGWRDKTIVKFDEKEVAKVTVENENGTFVFEREAAEGDDKSGEAGSGGASDEPEKSTTTSWTGQFQEAKATSAKGIEDFKASKVDDLLRAYKSLNASAFGDDKTAKDVGLEEPKATVTIELKGGAGKHVIYVGDTAEGTNRWVKTNAKDTLFSISSWAADWATAEPSKFQNKKEEENDAEGSAPSPHGH